MLNIRHFKSLSACCCLLFCIQISLQQRTKCTNNELRKKEIAYHFDSNTILTIDKFLHNRLNKRNFLNMLSEHLQQHKIEVKITEDNADLIIVEVAVNFAREGCIVVIINQDIDILVLLSHYMDDVCGQLIFESKTKWDIRKLKQKIGSKNSDFVPSCFLGLWHSHRLIMLQKTKF